MKKIATTLLCMLAVSLQGQVATDSAWRQEVKTVQLYRTGAELDFPVLTTGGGSTMTLEFDMLGAEAEALQWRIVHCDRHWVPDGLEPYEFMAGFESGTLDDYAFSFTTRKDYVHYRATVPQGYAHFIHSGNYVLYVDDENGATVLSRRFCVSEQALKVEAEVVRPFDGIDIERRQEVDVRLWPTPGMRPDHISVTVQQNGRLDNSRTLPFASYDGEAMAYRNRPENVFAGGNTFRFFDCSNLRAAIYNVAQVESYGGELFVLLRPEEDRSRKHFLSETTLNGGMKVNVWERDNPRLEAEYVWVNFSLPMAQPMLEGSIYIVGALTDWKMDSASRMDYNPEYRAYTKRLLLKQGYYAYQLLVGNGNRRAGDGKGRAESGRTATAALEGDHRETPNRYTVFVYQSSPSDRADRLLAVTRAGRE